LSADEGRNLSASLRVAATVVVMTAGVAAAIALPAMVGATAVDMS
jgi:hypothetical protein